jgi:hypothetical protein
MPTPYRSTNPQVVALSKLAFTLMCIALEIAIVSMAFVVYLQLQ